MAGRVRTSSLLPPLSGLHLPQPQWPLAIPPAFHTPFSVSLNLAFPPPRLLLLQIPKHTLYPSGAFSVVTFSRSFFLTVLFGSVTLITQELPIGGLFLLVISGDTTGFNYWLLRFSLPLHTPHLGFMRLAGWHHLFSFFPSVLDQHLKWYLAHSRHGVQVNSCLSE